MSSNMIKINDIHGPGVAEKFNELTLIDLENLLKYRHEFVDTDCPACLGVNVQKAFQHQGLEYCRCSDCETLYISPAPTEAMHLDYVINSSAMNYWRSNMPDDMVKSRQKLYLERVNFSIDMLKKNFANFNACLEVGAGRGEFANQLVKNTSLVDKIVILEPQTLNVKNDRIHLITGGFEELRKLDILFDVAFAWEVIEHILEPDNFLNTIHSTLKSGAPFIFSTPNERSVETRELKTESTNILFDHVRLYNPNSIEKLLNRNGFKLFYLSTPGKLDVQRLLEMKKKSSNFFLSNPSLNFILDQDEKVLEDFQKSLQSNLWSSHMRVVAIKV